MDGDSLNELKSNVVKYDMVQINKNRVTEESEKVIGGRVRKFVFGKRIADSESCFVPISGFSPSLSISIDSVLTRYTALEPKDIENTIREIKSYVTAENSYIDKNGTKRSIHKTIGDFSSWLRSLLYSKKSSIKRTDGTEVILSLVKSAIAKDPTGSETFDRDEVETIVAAICKVIKGRDPYKVDHFFFCSMD